MMASLIRSQAGLGRAERGVGMGLIVNGRGRFAF